MFDDLIVELDPPENRRGKCDGEKERHLPEAAVMLAYGLHLLRTVPELRTVELHPDGEHAKRFEIARWLSGRGFVRKISQGKTAFGGTYICGDKSIVITSIPGKGRCRRNGTRSKHYRGMQARHRQHEACRTDLTPA